MKYYLLSFFLSLSLLASSQSIDFNGVTSLDTKKITLGKVAKNRSGYYGAKEGNKFLVLDGTLHSKVKKRIELPLHKLLLKTKDSTYMALANPSYIPFSDLDRYIRYKKKARKKIFFEVEENFKEGILIFDFEVLGTISLNEDTVRAEFTAAEN